MRADEEDGPPGMGDPQLWKGRPRQLRVQGGLQAVVLALGFRLSAAASQ